MHLYVYYVVPRADTDRVREGIEAMQTRLAGAYGHRGRLVRRVEEGQPYDTWMEIYEQVGEAFEARLSIAFDQSGVRDLPAGPRHVERFADFD